MTECEQNAAAAPLCDKRYRDTCANKTPEPHECLFEIEVNDDREFRCNCCAECVEKCNDEI